MPILSLRVATRFSGRPVRAASGVGKMGSSASREGDDPLAAKQPPSRIVESQETPFEASSGANLLVDYVQNQSPAGKEAKEEEEASHMSINAKWGSDMEALGGRELHAETVTRAKDKAPAMTTLQSIPSSSYSPGVEGFGILSHVRVRTASISSILVEFEQFYSVIKEKIGSLQYDDLASAVDTFPEDTPESSPSIGDRAFDSRIAREDGHEERERQELERYAPGSATQANANCPLSVGPQTEIYLHPTTGKAIFDLEVLRSRGILRLHCPVLVRTLRQAIVDWHGYRCNKRSLTTDSISEPYAFMYHNRKKLRDLVDGVEEQAADHLGILLEFMEQQRPWKRIDSISKGTQKRIAHEELPVLYPRGKTVFTKDGGGWRAFKVDKVDTHAGAKGDRMLIHAYFLDFDHSGKTLVPHRSLLSVASYPGEKLIAGLDVVPEGEVRNPGFSPEKLVERGRQYWLYHKGPAYQEYFGDAWPSAPRESPLRVVVDYVTSSKPERQIDLCVPSNGCLCYNCFKDDLGIMPFYAEGNPWTEHCINSSQGVDTDMATERPQGCDEQQLLFCPSTALAFSLRHKSWKVVDAQSLSATETNDKPFSQLWMSNDENKQRINATVAAHLHPEPRYGVEDLVEGKSAGLNILLHGAPGTGKTLTAECLAEKYAAPLYMVNCGELGTELESFDQRLQESLLRAANWNAIALFNEADIFLSERDIPDLKRNAFVAVLLRCLEYSKCLLFLTTTKPGQLDEAVASRMHLTIGLADLNHKGQCRVWSNLLDNLGLDKLHRETLGSFVNFELLRMLNEEPLYSMNGRQILNCLRAAQAFAQGEGKLLDSEHIVKVMETGKKFREYMEDITQREESKRARSLGWR